MLKTLGMTHCFIATGLFRVIKCDHTHQASYNESNEYLYIGLLKLLNTISRVGWESL